MAPSNYIAQLEKGTPGIDPHRIDVYLKSHLLDPSLLRTDRFEGFMLDRQRRLLALIESATGKAAYAGSVAAEGIGVEGRVQKFAGLPVKAEVQRLN